MCERVWKSVKVWKKCERVWKNVQSVKNVKECERVLFFISFLLHWSSLPWCSLLISTLLPVLLLRTPQWGAIFWMCWLLSCSTLTNADPTDTLSKDKGGYQHSGGYSPALSLNGLKQREIKLEEGSAVLSQHVSHGMRRSFWLVNPMGVVQNSKGVVQNYSQIIR